MCTGTFLWLQELDERGFPILQPLPGIGAPDEEEEEEEAEEVREVRGPRSPSYSPPETGSCGGSPAESSASRSSDDEEEMETAEQQGTQRPSVCWCSRFTSSVRQ